MVLGVVRVVHVNPPLHEAVHVLTQNLALLIVRRCAVGPRREENRHVRFVHPGALQTLKQHRQDEIRTRLPKRV